MCRVGVMAAAAVITLFTATAHAQSSSTPSLGEIARRTQQTRAASKPATKVYTNADLAPKPEESAPATPAAAAPATAGYVSKSTGEVLTAEEMLAASQGKLDRDRAGMDEKYWRDQAAFLRKEMARAKEMIAGYQSAKPTTPAMGQVIAKELAKSEKMLAGLEKQWTGLEDAAHYAQVPKAWLEP